MSGLKGIAKNLTTLGSSHVVAVLQQVALVPLFIHVYGKAGYGEWLAISAAVSYLGTLDFGVQTFVNQDLTMRYHRGDMTDFHLNQSTALRMLLGIVCVAGLLSLLAFALPLQHMLKMDGRNGDPVVPALVVQAAVFLMALQALVTILFGYFSGTFMVFGRAHVGGYWSNIKSLALIVAALIAVLLRASFAWVAAAQLAALLLSLLGEVVHLRRAAPEVFPTLRYWDRALVPKILKPSGYFALLFSSGFLAYQLPILILQRASGGTAVTIFSVMRTIFSMTRNLLNALTMALGPEITGLFARRDWKGLSRLYNYSERLIFSIIPAVNISVLLLCPFLLTIWLKQPQLFVPGIYLMAAAISIVMSAKEHKSQFQYSTNTHKQLATFSFGSYVVLGVLWSFLIPRFGVAGLLWAWLGVEFAQLCYLVRQNTMLFREQEELDTRYLWSLAGLSAGSLAVAAVVLPFTRLYSLPAQIGFAALGGGLLLGLAVPLFNLVPVWAQVQGKLRRRFA